MTTRAIALVFTVISIGLVALLVFDGLPGKAESADPLVADVQLYEGIPLDATLLHLDKQALEKAYENHLLLLFSVWLKGDLTEDQRIRLGLKRARAAYNNAAQQIAKREQELLEQDRQQQLRSR